MIADDLAFLVVENDHEFNSVYCYIRVEYCLQREREIKCINTDSSRALNHFFSTVLPLIAPVQLRF